MGWNIKLFGIVVKIIKIMSVRLLVSRLGDRSVSWLVTISSKGRKASHPMPLSENFHMFHRDARNAVISIFFTSTKKTGKKANKTPDLVFRYKKKKNIYNSLLSCTHSISTFILIFRKKGADLSRHFLALSKKNSFLAGQPLVSIRFTVKGTNQL